MDTQIELSLDGLHKLFVLFYSSSLKVVKFILSAHTTQFAQPGWFYLSHKYGVGHLLGGGSYVTLTSPDRKDLTIIIETIVSEVSAI